MDKLSLRHIEITEESHSISLDSISPRAVLWLYTIDEALTAIGRNSLSRRLNAIEGVVKYEFNGHFGNAVHLTIEVDAQNVETSRNNTLNEVLELLNDALLHQYQENGDVLADSLNGTSLAVVAKEFSTSIDATIHDLSESNGESVLTVITNNAYLDYIIKTDDNVNKSHVYYSNSNN